MNGAFLLDPQQPVDHPRRQSIGLTRLDTLAQSAHKILNFYFAEMLSYEAGTRLGEDPEALHQMRVNSRRLRAVFDVFHAGLDPKVARKQQKGLRSLGRALGLVRDWDVFLAQAAADVRSLAETDQIEFESILAGWASERQAARADLVAYLEGANLQKFKVRFDQFVQNPDAGERLPEKRYFEGHLLPAPVAIGDQAACLLYVQLGIIRAYDPILPQAEMPILHAMRIEVKRLHYALDFLKEILGSEARSFLKAVKDLQDLLGELHDADVACLSLEKLLRETPDFASARFHSLYQFHLLKVNQRQQLIGRLPTAWQKFDSPENKQQLALAISRIG